MTEFEKITQKIVIPPINPDDIPFTIELMKLLNIYRPSLELPTAYIVNARLSPFFTDRGRGVNLIGLKSMGKGEIKKMTFNLLDRFIAFDVDKFTLAFFTRFIKETKSELKDIAVDIEDLSTTIDSGYPEVWYNLASKLIWDKTSGNATADMYDKDLELEIRKSQDISITVKSFCALTGMTNDIYKKLKKYDGYNSMWIDRFTDFFLFITKKQKQRINTEFNNDIRNRYDNKIKAVEIREKITKLIEQIHGKEYIEIELPNKILPFADSVSDELYIKVRDALYKEQHEENRSTVYFQGDLSVNAFLNGRDKITESDLAFYWLYRPNMLLRGFGSTVQKSIQNVGYCSDFETLSDRVKVSPERIKMILSKSGKALELIKYEGDTVSHTDVMSKALERQEKFIDGCVNI